jgi:hypothetical protein
MEGPMEVQSPYDLLVKVLFANMGQQGQGALIHISTLGDWLTRQLSTRIQKVRSERTSRRANGDGEDALDDGEPRHRPFTEAEVELDALYSALMTMFHTKLPRQDKNLHIFLGKSAELPDIDMTSSVPMDRLLRIFAWRRVFQTEYNHVGISARSLEVNDEVWILAGAPTPFILRPLSNGNYRLVVEAFVLGIMRGEGLEGGTLGLNEIIL